MTNVQISTPPVTNYPIRQEVESQVVNQNQTSIDSTSKKVLSPALEVLGASPQESKKSLDSINVQKIDLNDPDQVDEVSESEVSESSEVDDAEAARSKRRKMLAFLCFIIMSQITSICLLLPSNMKK